MSEPAHTSGGIAIIGMAGRFPGARDLETYWRNLRDGVESIVFFSEAELLAAGVDPELIADPNYVRAGSILEGTEMFDAAHFGINRREAELIDPQHRLFLECAWETLENAGYDPEQYAGAIGVYAGMRINSYLLANLASSREYLEGLLHFSGPNAFLTYLCSDKDFLTSRVAYKMNLRGPAVTVQAACATSLVAVCQACESLLSYGSDMVLAGGSSVTFPQIRGHLSQEGGMVSSDGHTRTFDAQSSGTIFGSGVGIVLLKRLEDAIKDRDTIHAVIKGAALNNDGAQKVSFSAPAINGQAEVIHLAQAVAGVDAGTIGFIEAHGTATPLGDPIEIAGLTQAFRQTTDKTGFCCLGSVKSNIGHLDAAAGIAGLLKGVLAIERGIIPPTLHYTAPNPNIDFASSPFFVSTKLTDWPRLEGAPRRGGISSFGVGGTNAHVAFEEAPVAPEASISQRPQLIVLSARTATALEKVSENLAAHLRQKPDANLADIAHTLRVGRRAFPHRRIVVARTATDAAAALEARDAKRVLSAANAPTTAPVVFLFPGQGAQSLGMGRELYATEPVFAREFDRCAELLRPHLEHDLREVVHPAPGREDEAAALLGQTRYTQPALFAMSYALAQLWMSWGLKPQAMAGHSVGEYVAACLAGVFTLDDALALVARRAALVQDLPGGAMLAVRLSEEELRTRLPAELSIAAINAPSLCVAAGPHEAIAAFEERLAADGVAARRLATSHAFHSAMVEPVVAPFAREVKKIALQAPHIPFVSCVTGDWITPELATSAEYWARHLREPVRFADAVATLCADSASVLLEVGPNQTLAPLARQHPARTPSQAVLASMPDAKDEAAGLARAAGQLWLAGIRFDWPAFVAHEDRRRVPLPTYPFERERFWVEPTKSVAGEPLRALTQVLETDGPMPATAPEAAPAQASDVLGEIKVLLTGLSGLNLDAVPAATTFLDLGFDSLFLTQVSGALQKRFQTKITFRQLLNELPNFEALAEYIQAHRPATSAPVARPISPPKAPTIVAPQPLAHGPFRPLQKELAAGLTVRQQAFLDDFIPRYNQRTAGSKRSTQEHRAHFADPRAVAGFKQAWKELIYPLVVNRSAGAKLWDIDGNEYVDVTCGFGVAFFGHQPKFVTDAVTLQLSRGMEIGPSSPLAGEVAAMVCAMTGLERATFCNTGSEAVTGALRIARTVSGRDKIAMFAGAYHGISDEILVRPRTPGDTQPVPITAGIPAEMSANLILLEYGDPSAFDVIRAHAGELAAVIVEPVQSRRPEFQPREFLHQLRAVTAEHDIALIFDEIISGFRAHPAGAQGYFGVQADLATYGKVLGGGLPIGVIAGAAKYMDAFDGGAWQFGDDSFPATGVTFFAGTFARHPLALAAAKAVLTRLRDDPEVQQRLSARTAKMMAEIAEIVAGTPFEVPHFSSSYYVRANDFPCSGLLFALLREKGLHIWENRPCFISTAHSDEDLAKIVSAFRESIAELREAGFFATPIGANEIPITDSQRELWLVCQQSPIASTACNETWTLHLDGPLEVTAFQRAAQTIVDRHDALRCTFSASGDTLIVAPKLTLNLPLVDLSALSDDERDARFKALCTTEAKRTFDLQRGPLLTLQLIRFDAQRHALLFDAHHLICDGWSCDVFLNELSTLYSARDGSSLPAAMQLRDYQRWESALHTTPEFAADAAFWLEQYRTVPPTLELPGDRPYPRRREYRGASEILMLPAELPQALSKLGARHGVTLFSVLLAGFKALLFRLTGQGDLCVGVPSSGQNLAGGDYLIGHCVNMLPMRTRIDGGQAFGDFAKVVQANVLEGFEHQRVTFGWLLQHLKLPRVPGRIPLIPVTFNLDPPLGHLHFAGLEHRLEANPRSAFQFDLGFNCDTTPQGLRLICHYNTDLFDVATIQRWLGHFRALLESVVANPAQPLSALPLGGDDGAVPADAIQFWPSSPTAGDDPVYDDVLYRAMTLDQSRHDVYRRAFAKTVRDKVVVDIGTGRDALLARMCVEAGARKVYAIELLERPAEKARALVESLGLSDRIVVLHGRSQEVHLPEKVDVCVSENVGHIGGAEGCDLILDDARRRFLKPDGLIIPGRCETRVAAVCLPDEVLANPVFEPLGAYYAGQLWQRAGYRHDFRLCLMGMSRAFLRSTDAVFENVDFTQPPVADYERAVALTITRDSRIDGFLLWLRLDAVPGETLEAIDHRDSWLPVYLPVFYPPIDVQAGDRIEATVHGAFAENRMNRDYRIAGRVVRQTGEAVEFAFDSWHYRRVYQHTPFYRQLFRGDAIPVARRLAVPAEWNGTDRPFPAGQGVQQIFEEQAARGPDAVAIEFGEQRTSYAELNARANRLARRLRALGVERGTSVGICMERSAELIAGILGILKAGGAYVPLDPSYPPERLALMLADTRASIVLTQRKVAVHLPRQGAQVLEIEEIDLTSGEASNPGFPSGGGDRAYVMFTSGSTGAPKGSAILHRGISRLVVNSDYVQFFADDAVVHGSNTSFDAATFEIWGALLNGARLVIVPKEVLLSPLGLAGLLRRSRVTILFLTTPLFHQIAREVPGEFGTLRYLVVGGDALDPAAARAVLESGRPPAQLINGYGPTETTTFAICHRVERVEPEAASIPIGRPIANTRVYLLDAAREPVPPGEPGEIYIGGPGVADGYVNRPELTAESFVPDPFSPEENARLYKTGDRARWRPDGTIDFLGRIDEQVKVRGFRVELGEIEAALRQHPAVDQCKIVARPNGAAGRTLAGYVTPRAGAALRGDEVREFLQARLPDFMVPGAVTVLDAFPLTANGKLDLPALAEPAGAAPRSEPAGTPIETGIAALWEEVLGRNHVSLDDDFFLVGGHSLLAIRLIGRMRERFRVDVPVQRLFETPTIRGLAEFVSARLRAPAAPQLESIVMIQRGDESRTPLFLVPGGWGGEVEFLVYRQLAQRLDAALPLYGLRTRDSNAEVLPDRTVEEFAAAFVAEICAFQPSGPYLLGGECVGGIIAYEMARQLAVAGREVALLLLLGTEWPNRESLDEFEAWERKRLRSQVWEARVRQPAQRHWQKLAGLPLGEKCRYLWERLRRPAPAARQGDALLAEREILTEYPRRLMAHHPKTHRTKVTLVIDAEAHAIFGSFGWDTHHPGGLEVHVVPGDHVSYIREHAPAAAAKLREILDRASHPLPC